MNILLLSVGTRNKVVQYFKKCFENYGKVIATDMSDIAPAVYDADVFYQVPRMTAPGYLDKIFEICEKEQVKGVLTLIDPELSLLAAHQEEFAQRGVKVIGSSYDLCEMALDKMKMYYWLKEHDYKCARSYAEKEAFLADLQKGEIQFPVFVKPIRGSASIAISKVEDLETLELLWKKNEGLMVQEFLKGQEIGADCYIDLISGETVSIFTKKKLLMRAGETDKAVSFKDEKLFALIEKFIAECGWRGQIDIDIFEIDGEYYISEVNPRFGGGYPHAYECGCNHIQLIANNLMGISNSAKIGEYKAGCYMMKYNEIMIRE